MEDRMNRRIGLVAFLGIFVSVAAFPQVAFQSGSPIYIDGNVALLASQKLVGTGVPLPGGLSSPAWKDASGNRIEWREVQGFPDPRGGKHATEHHSEVPDREGRQSVVRHL